MSATVEFVVLWIVEVNEIDKQLSALLACEASRVPALLCARTLCKDSDTTNFDGHFAFFADLRKGEREGGRGRGRGVKREWLGKEGKERGVVGGRKGRGKEGKERGENGWGRREGGKEKMEGGWRGEDSEREG